MSIEHECRWMLSAPTDGYWIECACGWRSLPLDEPKDAVNAFATHIVDTEPEVRCV